MKVLTITLLLVTGTVFAGSHPKHVVSVKQEKVVSVKVDQEKFVPGTRIKVKFIEVVEDGRCPTDVRCIWAGNAKAKFQFSKGSDTEVVELNTTLNPQTFEFGGYTFRLTGLLPRPRSNVRINRLGYVAAVSAKKH